MADRSLRPSKKVDYKLLHEGGLMSGGLLNAHLDAEQQRETEPKFEENVTLDGASGVGDSPTEIDIFVGQEEKDYLFGVDDNEEDCVGSDNIEEDDEECTRLITKLKEMEKLREKQKQEFKKIELKERIDRVQRQIRRNEEALLQTKRTAKGNEQMSLDKSRNCNKNTKIRFDLSDLRANKKVERSAERQMAKLGLIDSDDNTDSISSSDSDNEFCSSKKVMGTKMKKIKSGIIDKPTDKVVKKLDWPQAELKYEISGRMLEFQDLDFQQFVAGELEIITGSNISEAEKQARLNFLKKISYYAFDFEWNVVRNFYASWLKSIEKGEKSWQDDTTALEVRMLLGHAKLETYHNQRKFKFAKRQDYKTVEKDWYCPLYNKNKCRSKTAHNLNFRGQDRWVQHICAACLLKDGVKSKHPECSSVCPHQSD